MISLIVAMDENRLIGADNKLPWHFKEDLQYFKEVTMGHDIFMGRLTFESILSYRNQPLPGRHHYVASRNAEYNFDSVTVVSDIENFIQNYPPDRELFVIGGAKIYEQLLPLVDRLYITHIKHSYDGGDAWFPQVDESAWSVTAIKDSEDLQFLVYDRR